jgi:hypothetical protein
VQGFVTCAYGVHVVGRVLICYGIFDALASVRQEEDSSQSIILYIRYHTVIRFVLINAYLAFAV